MRAALTIAWRDFRTAFESPLAYVLIAVFLGASSLLFTIFLLGFSDASEQLRTLAAAQGDPTITQRLSLDRSVVSPTLHATCGLLIGLIPLLTMRALADERRQGTMELLLTAPVEAWSIVVGKFLGALGISCAAIALTVGQPLLLVAVAAPDLGPLLSSYAGLFLVAAALTAVGILASAMTDSSVAAGFIGFAMIAALVLLGAIGSQMKTNLGLVLRWFSPLVHFDLLAAGIVDLADIGYFVLFTAAALFCALRILDSQRWR